MASLANLLYGAGRKALMDLIRGGTRARDALESAARSLYKGFTRPQYREAITNARTSVRASDTVEQLGPNQRIPESQVLFDPYADLDASSGERFKVTIEVEFQPNPDAPILIRRTYWTGSKAPSGRDIAAHIAAYLNRQADKWGDTPGSQDAPGTGPDATPGGPAQIGYEIIDIIQGTGA